MLHGVGSVTRLICKPSNLYPADMVLGVSRRGTKVGYQAGLPHVIPYTIDISIRNAVPTNDG